MSPRAAAAAMVVLALLAAGCAQPSDEADVPGAASLPAITPETTPVTTSPAAPAPPPARVDPLAGPNALFAEDWENGAAGWIADGHVGEVDCGKGLDGCSLRVGPTPCCTGHQKLNHTLEIPLEDKLLVTFLYQANTSRPGVDTVLQVIFEEGWINLGVTGSAPGVFLASSVDYVDQPFVGWTGGAWYKVTLTLDGASGTARATLAHAGGGVIAESPERSLPAGVSTVTGIGVHAAQWSSGAAAPVYVDTLRVLRG